MSHYYLGCELYTTRITVLLYVCLVISIMGPWPGLSFTPGKKSKPDNQKTFSPMNQTFLKLLNPVFRTAL